jgi:hypothetical protein
MCSSLANRPKAPSFGMRGLFLLLFSITSSHAGMLSASFGAGDGGSDELSAYSVRRGTNFTNCFGLTDCFVTAAVPVSLGDGSFMEATARATIDSRSLFIKTQVTAYDYCNAGPGPEACMGMLGYASFGEYFYVDAPYSGMLLFDMQTDSQPITRMHIPITRGVNAVMPLKVETTLLYDVDSGLTADHAENTVSIANIQIVPEPVTAPWVLGGLCTSIALAEGRRRAGSGKGLSPRVHFPGKLFGSLSRGSYVWPAFMSVRVW